MCNNMNMWVASWPLFFPLAFVLTILCALCFGILLEESGRAFSIYFYFYAFSAFCSTLICRKRSLLTSLIAACGESPTCSLQCLRNAEISLIVVTDALTSVCSNEEIACFG